MKICLLIVPFKCTPCKLKLELFFMRCLFYGNSKKLGGARVSPFVFFAFIKQSSYIIYTIYFKSTKLNSSVFKLPSL